MNFSWNIFIHLGIISAALMIATVLRYKLRLLQRFLIPNALTAGFLLFVFYNVFAGRLPIGMSETQTAYLNTEQLGNIVYHLLNISFIAMALRAAPKQAMQQGAVSEKVDALGEVSKTKRSAASAVKGKRSVLGFTMAILSQFGLQALIGLLFTYLLMSTVMPQLFPGFGLLLPLGFAQGPGQAYAIGSGWSHFGFQEAGSVGLTFAALGFVFACFGGIFLCHVARRKRWVGQDALRNNQGMKNGIRINNRPSAAAMTTESDVIDTLSLHVALVLVVYLLSYLLLTGIVWLLSLLGPLGKDLGVNLWGINFIFSGITAMAVRVIMRGIGADFIIDTKTLNRISGFSVDVMVAAALGAISLVVIWQYLVPILVLSVIAGILICIVVPWYCSRMFSDYQFHRAILVYGISTGTLPTGLALLRMLDPEFETPVANDYMYAAGLTFVFAIPFILAINLPAYAASTGNMLYFWLAVGVSGSYILVSLIALLIIARGRVFTKGVWHTASLKKSGSSSYK